MAQETERGSLTIGHSEDRNHSQIHHYGIHYSLKAIYYIQSLALFPCTVHFIPLKFPSSTLHGLRPKPHRPPLLLIVSQNPVLNSTSLALNPKHLDLPCGFLDRSNDFLVLIFWIEFLRRHAFYLSTARLLLD